MFSWFAFFRHPQPEARIDDRERETLSARLRGIPGMREALVFTPTPDAVAHPFPDDEPAPMLALQLRFDAIAAMEAALGTEGALRSLAAGEALPDTLRGAAATHQAMLTRPFPAPNPALQTPQGELPCSYLVHYPGAADDLNAWLAYYLAHHPGLMARFPGVRQIEIYTCIDWCDALSWPREAMFQRNKLVFDTPAALSAGLLAPAIRDMRADYHQFPSFTGGNVHYPMTTRSIVP